MYILVTYDVNTEDKDGRKRLAKVARLCKDYGQRVQNSVFECVVTEVQMIQLKNNLLNIMDTTIDSIRIYFLNKNENRRIITLGADTSVDVEGTLII
mgnify:CR=1 FL=1